MNKQQLLDIENPTLPQAVIQQLLATGSKTSLEASRREMSKIYAALPRTKMRELPFEEILQCLQTATTLAGGGETETLPIGTIIKPDGKQKTA